MLAALINQQALVQDMVQRVESSEDDGRRKGGSDVDRIQKERGGAKTKKANQEEVPRYAFSSDSDVWEGNRNFTADFESEVEFLHFPSYFSSSERESSAESDGPTEGSEQVGEENCEPKKQTHLIVLVHGLIGEPETFDNMCQALINKYGEQVLVVCSLCPSLHNRINVIIDNSMRPRTLRAKLEGASTVGERN